MTSRLWRSIVATAPGEAPAVAEAGDAPEGEAGATGPVLAMFRRLPFDEEPAE